MYLYSPCMCVLLAYISVQHYVEHPWRLKGALDLETGVLAVVSCYTGTGVKPVLWKSSQSSLPLGHPCSTDESAFKYGQKSTGRSICSADSEQSHRLCFLFTLLHFLNIPEHTQCWRKKSTMEQAKRGDCTQSYQCKWRHRTLMLTADAKRWRDAIGLSWLWEEAVRSRVRWTIGQQLRLSSNRSSTYDVVQLHKLFSPKRHN